MVHVYFDRGSQIDSLFLAEIKKWMFFFEISDFLRDGGNMFVNVSGVFWIFLLVANQKPDTQDIHTLCIKFSPGLSKVPYREI